MGQRCSAVSWEGQGYLQYHMVQRTYVSMYRQVESRVETQKSEIHVGKTLLGTKTLQSQLPGSGVNAGAEDNMAVSSAIVEESGAEKTAATSESKDSAGVVGTDSSAAGPPTDGGAAESPKSPKNRAHISARSSDPESFDNISPKSKKGGTAINDHKTKVGSSKSSCEEDPRP